MEDVKRDMEKPWTAWFVVMLVLAKQKLPYVPLLKVVAIAKQATVLVPTTILAYQHYKTFSERLRFSCNG